MNTAVKRSILTGALAAGLIFASPLTAGAATLTSMPSIAQYDGASIPSAVADLTSRATITPQSPVYGEPASTLNFSVPKWSDETSVSQAFDEHGESWVAVQVPVDAKGNAFTKSTFAESGVGYIRAASVNFTKKAPAAPADSGAAYPSKLSELKQSAYLTEAADLYRTPSLVDSQKLTGAGAHIDAGGPTASHTFRFGDASDIFSAGGHNWVAVPTPSGGAPGGVAYLPADTGVRVVSNGPATVNPVQPTTTPTAPGPSATPTAVAEPSATATPSAIAAERVSAADSGSQPNWLAAGGSLLFGGLVIVLVYKLKRRAA